MWCVPELDDEYVSRMIDILEVYERPYDSDFPVICFDEKSKQLLSRKRRGSLPKPNKPRREDYEYVRHGTANLFVAVEPKGKNRTITVTKQRKGEDVALMLEKLVTEIYKDAKKLVFIVDNLNVHSESSIRKHLPEKRANAVLEKIEWHFTPKHASWLNMAEIEIGALSRQCLKRYYPTLQEMEKHVAIWTEKRNTENIGINWKFTAEDAAEKFKLNSGN
jgi:hypothetical protein